MAISNTKVFTKHLDGDVNDIFFGDYLAYKSEHDKIAKIKNAPPGGHYTQAELSGLGPLQKVNEGGQFIFDNPLEGNEVERTYTKYGLGFQITEEMMYDDLQKNFMSMPKELAKSAALKKETVFFDLFNSGFGTHTSWDGQFIFDNAVHTTLKTGEAINNAPAAGGSLSETTLQAAYEYFDNAIDSAGRPIVLMPKILLVPTELQWAAAVLLKTDAQVNSANNDINTIKDRGGLQIFVSRYLTSSTAWFVLSDEHDFRFLWKNDVELQSSDDFMTGNALFKATMRFTAFCNNYIGAYGNAGV